MKIPVFCLAVAVLSPAILEATLVDTLWTRTYNGPFSDDDEGKFVKVDRSGDVVVVGTTYDSKGSGRDIILLKYTSKGEMLYERLWDGGQSDDKVEELIIDSTNNIIIIGHSRKINSSECITIKYASDGTKLWERQYHGTGRFGSTGYCGAVNSTGEIWVGGGRGEINAFNLLLLKYTSSGELIWSYENNDSLSLTNELAVDSAEVIFVGVRVLKFEYWTTVPDVHGSALVGIGTNGEFLWAIALGDSFDSNSPGEDLLRIVQHHFRLTMISGFGYCGVIDWYNDRYLIYKFNREGVTQWVKTIVFAPNYIGSHGLLDILITSDERLLLFPIGYYNQIWIVLVDQDGNSEEKIISISDADASYSPSAVKLSPNGSVYLAGATYTDLENEDVSKCYLVKLNPSLQFEWITRLDGAAASKDGWNDIDCDAFGNAIAAGTVYYGAPRFTDLAVARYSELPVRVMATDPSRFSASAEFEAGISIFLNQGVDDRTVTDSTVYLVGARSGRHPLQISYDETNHVIDLYPLGTFLAGEDVSITLSDRITTDSGERLEGGYQFLVTKSTAASSMYFSRGTDFATTLSPYDYGCFVVDWDADGDDDILRFNWESSILLENDGNGEFVSSSLPPLSRFIIAVRDFDGDQLPDVAFIQDGGPDGFRRPLWLARRESLTKFRPFEQLPCTTFVHDAWTADLNSDGRLEFLVYSGSGWLGESQKTLQVLEFSPELGFTEKSAMMSSGNISEGYLGDIDRDGVCDFAFTENDRLNIRFGRGGDLFGQLESCPVGNIRSIQGANLLGDSALTFILPRLTDVTALLGYNNEDGCTRLGGLSPSSAMSVACGDMDGDRDIDLLSKSGYELWMHENLGQGSFATTLLQRSFSRDSRILNLLDADNDGDLDILTYAEPSMVVLINQNGYMHSDKSDLKFEMTTNDSSKEVDHLALSSDSDDVRFRIGGLPTWVRVFPDTGTTPAAIDIEVSMNDLLPGIYSDTIDVFADGAMNSPLQIPVELSVIGSTISAQPEELVFDVSTNALVSMVFLYCDLENVFFEIRKSSPWLSFFLFPAGGLSPQQLRVEADTSGLVTGVYIDTIFVSSPRALNSPLKIPVRLSYLPAETAVFPYPVPVSLTNGTIGFVAESASADRLEVHLLNANFALVKTGMWEIHPGHNEVSLDIAGMAPGVYVYRYLIQDPGNSFVRKGSGKIVVTE